MHEIDLVRTVQSKNTLMEETHVGGTHAVHIHDEAVDSVLDLLDTNNVNVTALGPSELSTYSVYARFKYNSE